MIMITISIMIILTNGMEVPGVALKQRLLPMVAVKQASGHLQDSCEVNDSDGHIIVIVLVKLLIIVKTPHLELLAPTFQSWFSSKLLLLPLIGFSFRCQHLRQHHRSRHR